MGGACPRRGWHWPGLRLTWGLRVPSLLCCVASPAAVVTIHMLRGDTSGRSFYIRIRDDVAADNREAALQAVPTACQRQAGVQASQPAPRMYFWLTDADVGNALCSLGRLKSRECYVLLHFVQEVAGTSCKLPCVPLLPARLPSSPSMPLCTPSVPASHSGGLACLPATDQPAQSHAHPSQLTSAAAVGAICSAEEAAHAVEAGWRARPPAVRGGGLAA